MSSRPGKVVPAVARLAAKAKAERSVRRRRLGRRVAIGAGAGAAVGLVAWLLLFSPVLAVRTIAVRGTTRLTPAQVRAAADVVRGTPLARVDEAAVVRRVEALKQVAQVRVTRGWPSTLRLQVVERCRSSAS